MPQDGNIERVYPSIGTTTEAAAGCILLPYCPFLSPLSRELLLFTMPDHHHHHHRVLESGWSIFRNPAHYE